MHALFLSTWFPAPPDNGSKARVFHLLRALAARHEVSLITFAPSDGPLPEVDCRSLGLCHHFQMIARRPFQQSARRRLLGLISPVPRDLAAMYSPEMAAAVRRAAAERPADAVIASTLATAGYARQVPAGARVLEEHNFLGRILAERVREKRARPWRQLTWRKDLAFERRTFRAFDLVIMVSEQDRDAVRAMRCATTTVAVVPNGVALNGPPAAVAPVAGRLIYPGAVTYQANLDAVRWFVTEIWPCVRAACPGATFEVTGRTDGVDVTRLAQVDGVTFTGYLEDLPGELARSWACVVPLRQGGGTRLKVLEAMGAGVPVIATAKGVEGLGLTPDHHYLRAEDAATFAAQIRRLSADPRWRTELARRARAVVAQRYDWRAIGTGFVDLIEEVARVGRHA
jgi:glycosyltransferase involved in cell wall biosynthesis